ncbi:hypothetical protein [Streptomyces sp. Amel2xC10]|uniref:hypothetical protein n=1 Tax=Streptomyces sp. Amel2xC10 TaxID=1305826 RepID=UPI000A0890BD|nr:hypothetical protein [Streptomyces sp. Amel2xC10]SMF07739.1 hypothetical protein SAMN02745830_01491 [Streptomyces sp. Amel2xC10]
MSLTELLGVGRVTVFPLEDLTVAYTTRSGDGRGLGEVGVVAVVGERGDGEEVWRLAQGLGGRVPVQEQARWILIQASRARAVAAFTELRDVKWTAYVRRRFVLDALFANHEVLVTGRMELPGRFR